MKSVSSHALILIMWRCRCFYLDGTTMNSKEMRKNPCCFLSEVKRPSATIVPGHGSRGI